MSPVDNVGILVIGYNRPLHLTNLLNQLRFMHPNNLMIFIDGAIESDFENYYLVSECRKIVNSIDWIKDFRTFFPDTNLGCALGVTSAITWAFTIFDKLIILEDDLVIHKNAIDFFRETLDKYGSHKQIFGITGFLPIRSESRIYLSRYPQIWGWATWKDRWEQYLLIGNTSRSTLYLKIIAYFRFNLLLSFFHSINNLQVERRIIDTWDYKLMKLFILNRYFFVLPPINLVVNNGFDSKATHTKYNTGSYPDISLQNYKSNFNLAVPLYNKNIDKLVLRFKTRVVLLLIWNRLKYYIKLITR